MSCNLPNIIYLKFFSYPFRCHLFQTNGIIGFILPQYVISVILHIVLTVIPLVRAECLAMGQQITMLPKLPIANWMLSDPPSHEAGHTQLYSIIKWTSYKWDWAHRGPESTSESHEEVVQTPVVPTPAVLTSLLNLLLAAWEAPYHQLTSSLRWP